jgi:hypothetical protein
MRSADLLLLPVPRKVAFTRGVCSLPDQMTLHLGERRESAATCELSARVVASPGQAAVRFHDAASAPAGLMASSRAAEGYALRIAEDGVDVWSGDEAGRLYGAMTLRQLIRQFGRRLPCLVISDAPALARRGVQLCFPQGHTEYRRAYMRHLVPWLGRLKINELYLYLESYFDFPSLPHMAGPGAMTPSDVRELDDLCRSYNITLIPMLNTLGHCGELLATQRFQRLGEYKPPEHGRVVRPFNLCSSSRDVERLVDGMLDDLMACFTSPVLHVGGDEVSCIGECPACKRLSAILSPFERYARYYGRILERLRRNNRRGGIWGDLLWHYSEKQSAAGRKRLFRSWREWGAIIYDWHYDGGGRESLDRFVGAGLETVACSSTNLCYSSALWPAQRVNQRELFSDAIKAGAAGGMTSDWGNFTGLHHEQFNYLDATGATLLWSGPRADQLAPGLPLDRFERAWSCQRYNVRTRALTDYLHAVGDAKGPVLSPLPLRGHGLRKCLYHTVNPLDFWACAGGALDHTRFAQYRTGVAQARRLWNLLARNPAFRLDRYIKHLEGPLLGHEHLIDGFERLESVYRLYDQAARCQYTNPTRFRALLDLAAERCEAPSGSYGALVAHLAAMRRSLGLEQSSLHRVRAVQANLRELAAFLRHLKRSHRPLPAFQQFHTVFMEPYRTYWYGDREHEWAAEPPRFRRFSLRDSRIPIGSPLRVERETV